MAGETTLQAIAEWIRLRSIWLQDVLPETRATFPCAATYSNVLRTVDPAQVNQVLMDLLTRLRATKRLPGEQLHVVLDGKTLRGTLQHLAEDQRPMHHLNLYEVKTGIVLKEAIVAEKANELTHMKAFLTPVLLQGRIISADALYTQRSLCQDVIAAGADYLLLVKHTQPTLYEDLSFFFRAPLVIVAIGAPPPAAPKDMGGWNIVCCGLRPNSMTFWRVTGLEWDKSSAYDVVWNMPLNVHRRSSTGLRALRPNRLIPLASSN